MSNRWSECAVAGVLLVGLGCGGGTSNSSTRHTASFPEVIHPQEKSRLNPDWAYQGTVSAIGPDWVELGVGWRGADPDSCPSKRKEQPDNLKKPKRLLATGPYIGGDPRELNEITYRLSDLQIGDVVHIVTGVTRDGDEYCLIIMLDRRPRGKIPKIPTQLAPEGEMDIHVRNQAGQDWEENGIPIPKRFLDNHGRAPWTNPPYPPVSPQPREVVAKP